METIIITGSSSGIGSYLVDYYLEQGYRVVGCCRGNMNHTRGIFFQNKQTNFISYNLDIMSQTEVEDFFGSYRTNFKSTADVLINCAGIASMNHFSFTPKITARNIVETNYLGTFSMCQLFSHFANKGRIVNFSSVAVNLNLAGETAYACSKAAVEQLTKNLSKEIAPITVNCISPNPIKTNLLKGFDEAKLNKIIELQAIKRFGKFEDVSNVIDFFISPKSEMVTGQVITLGGIL